VYINAEPEARANMSEMLTIQVVHCTEPEAPSFLLGTAPAELNPNSFQRHRFDVRTNAVHPLLGSECSAPAQALQKAFREQSEFVTYSRWVNAQVRT
jgi:hypothetical protein